MKTRKPLQAKSTDRIMRAILPAEFKMVSDKRSNGYKLINLLYGVEIDQVGEYMQQVYDDSFVETMDLSNDGLLYDVYLSEIPKSQFLNTTVSGAVKIKITNWDSGGGDSEFWDGDPTRVSLESTMPLSGAVQSGHIIGLNYFRDNISGYGYLLVNSDTDQDEYLNLSGSQWRFNLDNKGRILNWTGLWPGIGTFNFQEQGRDDLIAPLGSGYLYRKYPLTRRVRDDSGVYWDIDHYEPYLGWVRDENWNVVAAVNYSGDYYYTVEGEKVWYRTAFNNPYGSGNYTTEYLPLRNPPISGTLKIYDIDMLDSSGNATEISSAGQTVYRKQSPYILNGSPTGIFDPTYMGYDSVVPTDRGFGEIEGQAADAFVDTSWEYQYAGGYVDEGTMQYVEGSGELTNLVKIVNPVSRYIAEYNFKIYDQAKYITSLEATRYLSLDTDTPIYSVDNVFNNEEQLEYNFTRDPKWSSERSRYITFNGWKIRPNSRISKIDFKIPVVIDSGSLDRFFAVKGRKQTIGYPAGYVPDIATGKRYVLDCQFDRQVSLGTVTENDYSGSGNFLDWVNTGSNQIFRIALDDNYGKKIRYLNGSGYFHRDSTDFILDNTFFRFRFRADSPRKLTLMQLEQADGEHYIKVDVNTNGTISVYGNGVEYHSREGITFNSEMQDLILRYYPDDEYSEYPIYEMYLSSDYGYVPLRTFLREGDTFAVSGSILHVFQNCSVDADIFQIYYETNYGNFS